MAKRKQSSRTPKARHKKKKTKAAQRRKVERLKRRNAKRRKTSRAKVALTGALHVAVSAMMAVLHPKCAFRLAMIVAGMMLAGDRRTASAWFVAAGVLDDWDCFYDLLIRIGRQYVEPLALVVLRLVVQKFDPGPNGRIRIALDDSPTARFGPCVEGAGVHHHPTPGPADGEFLYGHNWVCLSWLATHPRWGIIALPIRAFLYVRAVDVPTLNQKYGWKFETKHSLAAKLVGWFVITLRSLGVVAAVWVVVDGTYAARPFLSQVLATGAMVISRLRKDAVLFDLPPAERPKGQRGPRRNYGKNRISLAKRAAHRDGWSTITYLCRNEQVTRSYKTFEATSRLVGGKLRVVIVRFEHGEWAAYFCTEPSVGVQDILEAVAARWAIEEHFHDVKEVWGAGQQQVRNVWSNIACWHLNEWLFTLVEWSCWDEPQSALVDRSDRSWDDTERRPSHADRRRKIAREMLENEFLTSLPPTPQLPIIRACFEKILSLCV
jgi:hypothetical protein